MGFMGFISYKMTTEVTNKVKKAHCLENTPQQLQAAGQVMHVVKAVLMCDYLRSQFVCNREITLNTQEKGIVFRSTLALI